MSKFLYVIVLGFLFLLSSCEDPYIYEPPSGVERPKDIFGSMYDEILSLDTIGISKQIADGLPKIDVKEIKLAFRKQKNNADFDIQKFVRDQQQILQETFQNFHLNCGLLFCTTPPTSRNILPS